MNMRLWGLVLGAAMTQVACGAGSVETGDAEEVGQTNGRLVYTLNINAAHKIDFYEYDFGISGTHETMPVGETEALRLPNDEPRSLSELFKLVRPDSDVPEALELADARVFASRERTRQMLADDPNFFSNLAQPEAVESSAERFEAGEGLGKSSEAAITCSGDFFGDQWGAAWFKQNFGTGFSNGVRCPAAPRNAASFSATETITNAFTGEVRYTSTRILQWKQMEGDFTNAGSTKGLLVSAGATTGVLHWNHSIAPRTVSIVTMNPGAGNTEWLASGVSPCSHLHRTIVWCTAS